MDNKSLSHTKWKCHCHIVFIPKYRKKQLYESVKKDVLEIISTQSVSSFMGYLKGKSTLMIYDRQPELQSKSSKAFWARGYYVATVGNIAEAAIKKYIQGQSEESRKEDSEGAYF